MTRLEFEQEKTKRIAVLTEALRAMDVSSLAIHSSSKQAIADALIKIELEQYPEMTRTKLNLENEKPV